MTKTNEIKTAAGSDAREVDTNSSVTKFAPRSSLFAASLRKLLDSTGLFTRAEWANYLGISQPAISQWVKDKTFPKPEHLTGIINALECSDDIPDEPISSFDELSRRLIHEVTPLSRKRLFAERTIAQYMVRPIREAFLSAVGRLTAARQREIYTAAAEMARNADAEQSAAISYIEKARKLLEEMLIRVGASSACLYMLDDIGELRLVFMPGVKYREPMHGSALYSQDRRWETETFLPDASQRRHAMRDAQCDPLADVLAGEELLFGDFVQREGVKSAARFAFKNESRNNMILFVNFKDRTEFDDKLKSDLRSAFGSLKEWYPHVRRDLAEKNQNRFPSFQLPTMYWNHPDKKKQSQSFLNWSLTQIIQQLFTHIGLSSKSAYGVIYVYDRENNMLRCNAIHKYRDNVREPRPINIVKDKSLASWAALRRQAILIKDRENSEFSKRFNPLREESQSQLIIPLIADYDLAGVLCIESLHKDAFPPSVVRPAWRIANQMSLLWSKQLTERKAKLYQEIVSVLDQNPRKPLEKIAVSCEGLLHMASRSVIWKYESDSDDFTESGATYVTSGKPPRKGGWTQFVAKNSVPVFLSKITQTRKCDAKQWVDGEWRPIDIRTPSTINKRSIEESVKCELGIPLIVEQKCVAVLWIKYDHAVSEPVNDAWHTAQAHAEDAIRLIVARAA